MKKKKLLVSLLALSTLVLFVTSCFGPLDRALEETQKKEKERKKLVRQSLIDSLSSTSVTVFVPIEFSWSTDCGCYPNRDVETMEIITWFINKRPDLKIKNWKYDSYTHGSNTLYNGIWIDFEPIQKTVTGSVSEKPKESDMSGIVEIPKNGSFYKTLGMTNNDESRAFAKKWGIPWRNNGALIHPGDRFKFKLVKVWEPAK